MPELLQDFKNELEGELKNILSYWMKYGTDEKYGGFIGRIDFFNNPDVQADKGSVLNSRILWSFSAAYNYTKDTIYLQCAQRAYDYFIDHFIDKKYGGVYWSVDYKGNASGTKKQVYAQSFAIYAMSEFYRASGTTAAMQHAVDLFAVIEQYSYDNIIGGYIDAFAENWDGMKDVRLSEKDANEKKTMNTHLHILEAYSNLYRIWSYDLLKTKIQALLQNFIDYIIDHKTGHLVLFFDEDWKRKSTMISYGHDIEAAWLLQEAAAAIDDAAFIAQTKELALVMTDAASEGLDTDGGLWYEYEPASRHLIKEKHWWPQAEAMVGFFNAWQLSGKDVYLEAAVNNWHFTKQYICDKENGEWVWGVKADYTIMKEQDKAGTWKCPYHNSRACLEIIKRIKDM